MKMNCDEAFEALTDPRQNEHPALERHLRACPRCRQMRDVLAPALALFAGEAPAEPACVAAPDQADGEAAEHSKTGRLLSTAAVRAADEAARKLQSRRRPRRASARLAGLLRLAAMFVLGAGAAFSLAALGSSSGERTASPATTSATGPCLWTTASGPAGHATTTSPRAKQVILTCVACHLPAAGR